MFKLSRDDARAVPLTLPPFEDEPAPERGASPGPGDGAGGENEAGDLRAAAEESLRAAREEAEEILSAARSRAADILEEASRNAESARKEASERGFNAGYADGTEKAEREGKAALKTRRAELDGENRENIGALFSSVNRELAEARRELAGSVRELSMTIARRVVGNALRADKNFISMINEAVSGVGAGERLTVRLDPRAAERLFPGGTASLTVDGAEVKATVIPDITLSEHGLLIDFGREDRIMRADAGAETQLDAIDSALRVMEEDGDDA
ncbi:MAG: hypothetical protein LBD49_06465 [Oscillospiraceae bacterium]|nr:hypothetical protein [Oscillospiraceae bacterium]